MTLLRPVLAVLALAGASITAFAASEEIQVYLDDLSAPGQFGIDVHNNLALVGVKRPEYAGQQRAHRTYRLTPELYYGLTRDLELGLYLLGSRSANGTSTVDGSKLRLKYIAPHDESAGFFWGANLEVGRTARRVSELPWNAQLKGILGWRGAGWTLGANPNLDWSLSKGGGPATASLDLKAARTVADGTQLGLELYNDLGPARRLDALSRNSKSLYVVLDQDLGRDIDLNLGLGRGLTSEGDRWVLKFIVGTHF
jgi:hypothetical protein